MSASPADTRRPVLALLTSHWLAMTGTGLVLVALIAWAGLLPAQLRHGEPNPYVGVATTAIGAVLLLGIGLALLGLRLGRKRLKERLGAVLADEGTPWRRLLIFFVVTGLASALVASQFSLRIVHGMESRQFCGSCHVMTPEARAFPNGPHAGILCVDCHVGEGALGLIESKVQGTKQLWSVITNTVEKPIATAIEAGKMIPSRETCEGCHWKEQPAKARVMLIQRYSDDEKNTPESTVLTMNVGGTEMGGIHGAHHGRGIEIDFVALDAKRQEIPLVEYRNATTGVQRTYVAKGADAAALQGKPRLRMQCFDCHNRPAHAFQMPDRAIDRSIALGRIRDDLPFVKKQGVEILRASYADSAAAAAAIPAALSAYYARAYPDLAQSRAADIAAAGVELALIYGRNVFPEYGLDWGTYPDNRGHQDSPGCFRCHDDLHTTASGEKITKNCFRCHFPSAVGETDPKVLELLGADRLLEKMQKR